jgi:hypothetical protein
VNAKLRKLKKKAMFLKARSEGWGEERIGVKVSFSEGIGLNYLEGPFQVLFV